MDSLDGLVRELLDFYSDDECGTGPGLIARLDDLALRTGQPAGLGGGGHGAPGSRPPASLDAVHWSTRIKIEAIDLDTRLRRSMYPQSWERALRAIPAGAAHSPIPVKEITGKVGAWHSTARTVLGLQRPAMYFGHVRCLACGERRIYGRANAYKPRAWCTNAACRDVDPVTGEATGGPARYEGPRLYLLTRNRVA